MPTRISPNSVGLAGEFAVLSRLALWGYDANMTLGHTKGVDILVSDPRTNNFYRIEVKTKMSSRKKDKDSESQLFGRVVSDWMMSQKHERIIEPNLWYCFVMFEGDKKVARFFLVPSKVVAEYVRAQHQLWLEENKTHKDNPMRNFRVGRRGETYKIPTPTLEEYEDNWEFRE